MLRLFYSFYEVPAKVPRLDTKVVKLEMEKVPKDGQRTLGEDGDEKAGHLKAEDETQQKRWGALTERKFRTQKEEKHQKQNETLQQDSESQKLEVIDGDDDKEEMKGFLSHSKPKVNCSPMLTLTPVKVIDETQCKLLLEDKVSQKQEEITTVKDSEPTKTTPDTKPTVPDKKVCTKREVGNGVKTQESAPLECKSGLSTSIGHQDVKPEMTTPPSTSGKASAPHAGVKRKRSESGDSDSSRPSGSHQLPSGGSVQHSQKDSKPELKNVQDVKPSTNLNDSKCGSAPKYHKPTTSPRDTKPVVISPNKKLHVTLKDAMISPAVHIIKSVSTPQNVTMSSSSQSVKSINTYASAKSAVSSQNVSSPSSPLILKSASVALDKKSVPISQASNSYSSTKDVKSLSSQKTKSPSLKGPISKNSKAESTPKETHSSTNSRDTKPSSSSKESKPTVKYTHQSQQTVSYTIVSCGVNGDNGKFPSGPNSPKAPLKMLIKSSESKDSNSKTCFIASGPLGIVKESKQKVIYPSSAKGNSKESKSSPIKTSVGTCTESGSSKHKQPKEKKSRHSESKSNLKPKKASSKFATSFAREPHVSHKTENKSLLLASAKPTQIRNISKSAQDVYNFVTEEKEEMPQKSKEGFKGPMKASVVKTPVCTPEVLHGNVQCALQTVIAPHIPLCNSLEPEQSEAVNLSQKPSPSDHQTRASSSPPNSHANGKIPAPSNHCQTKVAVSSLSHSSMDNSYTYMYAIDLSKAKTAPKSMESSSESKPSSGITASKTLVPQGKCASPDSVQELTETHAENSTAPSVVKKPQEKLQPGRTDDITMTSTAHALPAAAHTLPSAAHTLPSAAHTMPSAAHNQTIASYTKSGVQPLKVSNSLAMVVANLASSAVSNLVSSIKLASGKAPSPETSSLEEPSTTISLPNTSKATIFQVITPSTSDTKSKTISTTCQDPTSSLEPVTSRLAPLLAKSSAEVTCSINSDTSSDKAVPGGCKTDQTCPDSTVASQAPVSTTETDPPSQSVSACQPEVSSTKPPDSKPSSSSPKPLAADVPKTIITVPVPLLPSQATPLSRVKSNDLTVDIDQSKSKTLQEKPVQQIGDPTRSEEPESSVTLSPSQQDSSPLTTSVSLTPPTVSISSITTSSSPTTVSISLSPNRSSPTATSSAPTSSNNSSTIISISLTGASAASTVNSTSSASVTSASTTISAASALKSTDSVTTSAVIKQNTTLKRAVSEEKTFLTSSPKKQSLGKGFQSPGKKLEASVSKLLLPKDPRKIDNFLFDTLPGERESPTSTSSPKPKDLLSPEAEEPQSSSFMEETIISVARGTLPEVSDKTPADSSEPLFTAVHHLPKTISQTSKAHAARKSSSSASNSSPSLPSSKPNNNVIQTTKISTLIPKSSSAASKSYMYAKACSYPNLTSIPASRGFLHAAFPHASMMHPDLTAAMLNGTNNFVRSLIAAQQASRPTLPRFHASVLNPNYHLPSKVTMPHSSPKPHMVQTSSKVSSTASKSAYQKPAKSQVSQRFQGAPASSKSSPLSLNSQGPSAGHSISSVGDADHSKSLSLPSTCSPAQDHKGEEGKSIKLRAMPPLTIPKSGLGGTTLKLQRSPGSTDHYVLSPGGTTSHHYHQGGEKSKSSRESKRSNSVGSAGSKTPTSPLSPKDSVFSGGRQRVPTIKISDINRNPIIVDSGSGNTDATASTSVSITSTASTGNKKSSSSSSNNNNNNNNHSHNHRTASSSSSSSRPPSASSTSSLSPSSSVAHNNNNNSNNNLSSPNNSGANQRTSSRGGDRGSDSSCSPTGSAPERSPARDCRRPPSAEFLLPHHQRWHGFPTAELLFHGFKLPAHAHFQELHYDTDAMPLDYSQSSSKS